MSISEYLREPADQALAAYCRLRCPANAPFQVRLIHRWLGATVTLTEQRPMLRDSKRWTKNPIAQFRYNELRDEWTLFWLDQHERWNPVDDLGGCHFLTSLLVFVDRDPTGIFWS